LTSHRPRLPTELDFSGKKLDLSSRTHIMGVLNVTPDSFSDGGEFLDPSKALARAEKLIEDGADVLDVGGESTRPGSESISADVEFSRVAPVLKGLASMRISVPVSIDTWKHEVAERALDLGAHAINDISGLRFDPGLADLAARYGAGLILSHIKGTPKNMQVDPTYDDVVAEIKEFLKNSASVAAAAGVGDGSIVIDPGIGFGKTLRNNLEIFKRLGEIVDLGYPVLVGPSRKSFIGAILDVPVDDRLEGTLAASVISVMNGASMIRVHDVKEARRAVSIADAILRA
jgi:dihydropteroate synthase